MPTVNVTVKDFWLPEGKKRWVLKDLSDKTYGVPAALSGQVLKGYTYELVYKEDYWNNKVYLVVEKVTPIGGASSQPSQSQSRVADFPPQPNYKDEEIACLAILKCMNPLPIGDVAAVTHALRTAAMGLREFRKWQRNQLPLRGSVKDELNDEIPDWGEDKS